MRVIVEVRAPLPSVPHLNIPQVRVLVPGVPAHQLLQIHWLQLWVLVAFWQISNPVLESHILWICLLKNNTSDTSYPWPWVHEINIWVWVVYLRYSPKMWVHGEGVENRDRKGLKAIQAYMGDHVSNQDRILLRPVWETSSDTSQLSHEVWEGCEVYLQNISYWLTVTSRCINFLLLPACSWMGQAHSCKVKRY